MRRATRSVLSVTRLWYRIVRLKPDATDVVQTFRSAMEQRRLEVADGFGSEGVGHVDVGRLDLDVRCELRFRRESRLDLGLAPARRLVAIHPVVGIGQQRFVGRPVLREYRRAGT